MTTRRSSLNFVQMPKRGETHAGLWHDCYVRDFATNQQSDGNSTSADALLLEMEQFQVNPYYTYCFKEWQKALSGTAQMHFCTATSDTRVLVGLGVDSALDTGLTIHHTYGMPYIPGSALKGLAASFARRRLGPDWLPDSPNYLELFGTQEQSGVVDFLDALMRPEEGKAPFAKDIMSVHQFGYYSEDAKAPTDAEKLNIVSFLSVTKGQTFLIPLAGDAAWCAIAIQILTQALSLEGIGAKTNAGYGRMTVQRFVDPVMQVVERFVETHNLNKIATMPNKNGVIDQAVRAFVRDQRSMDIKEQILIARILRDVMKANGKDSSLAYQDIRKLAERNI